MRLATLLALLLSFTAASAGSDPRLEVLWRHVHNQPNFARVDQLVVESGDLYVRGWLEVRDWLNAEEHVVYWRRFDAKFRRECSIPIPECYTLQQFRDWKEGDVASR